MSTDRYSGMGGSFILNAAGEMEPGDEVTRARVAEQEFYNELVRQEFAVGYDDEDDDPPPAKPIEKPRLKPTEPSADDASNP